MSEGLNVLVAHKQTKRIKSWLEEGLDTKIFITPSEEPDEVELQIPDYDLVVLSVDLVQRGKGLVGRKKSKPALELLSRLEKKQIKTPVILTSAVDAELFHIVQVQPNVRLAVEGTEFEQGILQGAKSLLQKKPDVPASKKVEKPAELEISLTGGNDLEWTLSGPITDEGRTTFKREILDRLKHLSKLVEHIVDEGEKWKGGEGENWETYFKMVGDELSGEIFSDLQFRSKFNRLAGETKGIRIRFVVEREVHPIILEALRDEVLEKYWMLEAPIYRRLTSPGVHYALFQDEADKIRLLSCLIIEAYTPEEDVDLEVGGSVVTLKPLPQVHTEAQWLRTKLAANREAWRIGRVARIRTGSNGQAVVETVGYENGDWRKRKRTSESFSAALEHVLADYGTWDIVHYAGHSYYDDEAQIDERIGKAGYIFFSADPLDYMDALTFALHLRESEIKLLCLSSCHSSEEDFVFQMAEQSIPAVVGFRWDVDDELAEKYTEAFYSSLLEQRSLEEAFLAARKKLHLKRPRDPIWASPMLVIQVRAI